MRYILLIYSDEKVMEGMSEQEMEAHMGAWFQYTEELGKSGKMLGGEALQPTSTATTVRANESKTLTSDGPFAETKEQLGGYYIVEANDLDEAIEWAVKMPHIPEGGTVEVRPVMEFESP
jgi:hypothetical protein